MSKNVNNDVSKDPPIATHPGQVVGWLAYTPCRQSEVVSGLEPQSISIMSGS